MPQRSQGEESRALFQAVTRSCTYALSKLSEKLIRVAG